MVTEVIGAGINGIDSYIVKVEVDISDGLPVFELIGLLNSEVREAKERVKVSLKNCGIYMEPKRITINLSPANIRKEGTGYDLPIAIGMLAGLGYVSKTSLENILFVGEIGLNGEIKYIKGVLPITMEAQKRGISTVIVPKGNAKEAAIVKGMKVVGVRHIEELMKYLNSENKDELIPPTTADIDDYLQSDFYNLPDFKDVSGQEAAKRGLEIAAAGFHNVLMIGPPGAGKSMMAKRLPSIMPKMTLKECLEVTKIYSVCGLLESDKPLISTRPFCSPHHTASYSSMTGGGNSPRPGLISRSHKGVLFLDEVVHFSSATLEILRQPIEDKVIQVTRANWNQTFPADFMLIAAMNPCPCGMYPDLNKCNCTPDKIRHYIGKISGPILDRIDLCIETSKVEIKDINREGSLSSEVMREQVLKAIDAQKERYKGTDIVFNSSLSAGNIDEYIVLGKKEKSLMEKVYNKLGLSARGYHRILKVARTIADIDGSKDVECKHLLEAVCYRGVEDKYFNI